jgi:putative ABC transport system permease protein
MNLLKYIWRNVKRNKLRTALTVLSIGSSLALLTVLNGYLAMNEVWGKEAEKYNRIVVLNNQGFAFPLPISYVDEVRKVKGVEAASEFQWYGGTYKDEEMVFSQFGVDADAVFDVWDEYKIDPDVLAEWKRNRRGCVVDRRLAESRDWKKGERIPIKSTWYEFPLDLEMVGTFDTPSRVDMVFFHWDYLDEGLRAAGARGSGTAGTIFAKAASKADVTRASEAIDAMFASSDNPTNTRTEAAFSQMFAEMIGDVAFLIQLIGILIVFSLVLVAGNAMAMSMRERTTEIAVLKAIGFTRSRVMTMVVGEACWISLIGGIVGVLMGCLFIQGLHGIARQIFPLSILDMLGPWLLYLIIAAAGVGIASGIVPAARAAQLSVVNGLRRVV